MDSPSGLGASSPDPLNDSDELGSFLPLSSAVKRVTRSHQSTRLLSLGEQNKATSTFSSPRKQTFHLDVGNNISPQKIRVTVETDDQGNEENLENEASNGRSHKKGRNDAVRRRLFTNAPSSTSKSAPRRQGAPSSKSVSPSKSARKSLKKTTTTTTTTRVPLRDLSDEDNDHFFFNDQFNHQDTTIMAPAATPKPRRGRPRRTATPLPARAAGSKRSASPEASASTAATPAKRTRRSRTASPKLEEEPIFETADAAAEPSPVKKTTRATPKKATASSAKKTAAKATPKKTTRASAKKDSTSAVQSTPRRNPRRATTASAASASASETESAAESRPRRRGRPRRRPANADEMAAIAEQNESIEQLPLPDISAPSVSPAPTAETDLNTQSRAPAEDRAAPASPTTTSLSSVDLIRTQTPIVESDDEIASARQTESIPQISTPRLSTPRGSAQTFAHIFTPHFSSPQMSTPRASTQTSARISTLRHTISPGEDELTQIQPASTNIQNGSIEPATSVNDDDHVPAVLASLINEDAIAEAAHVNDEEFLPAPATEPAAIHEELATVLDHGEAATENDSASIEHGDAIEEHAFVEDEEIPQASTKDEKPNAESAAAASAAATSIDEPETRLVSESIEEVETTATNHPADDNSNYGGDNASNSGDNASNSGNNNHIEGFAMSTHIDTEIVVEDPAANNYSNNSDAFYEPSSPPAPPRSARLHETSSPAIRSAPIHDLSSPPASHHGALYDPSSPPSPSLQPASHSAAARDSSSRPSSPTPASQSAAVLGPSSPSAYHPLPSSIQPPPHSFVAPSGSTSSDGDGEIDVVATDAMTETGEHSDVEPHHSDAAHTSIRDQDTIAQGEDFSMIGMESLQSSMHMSHSELPEMGEITSRIVSRTLESLRHGNQDDNDDERGMSTLDFIIQPSDSTASSLAPSPAPPSASHFSAAASSSPVHISNRDFESSHLSQRSSPLRPVGSPKKRQEPLGKLIARKSLHEAQAEATPSTSHSVGSTEDPEPSVHGEAHHPVQTADAFEDSFSEIPESILEAAIPETTNTVYFSQQQADLTGRVPSHASPSAQTGPGRNEDQIGESDQDHAPLDGPVSDDPIHFSTGAAAAASSAIKEVRTMPHIEVSSHHSDDDVSNDGDNEDDDDGEVAHAHVQNLKAPSESDIICSPSLRATQPFNRVARPPSHITAHGRSSKTPPAMLSSARPHPAAGRHVESSDQADRLSLASDGLRPSLSPIVRAGRALQSVTSDPPSPKDGDPFLRSPFRRSITREVQSPAETPQHDVASTSDAPQPTEATTPAPVEVTTPAQAQAPPSSARPLWSIAMAPLSGLKSLVVNSAQIISPRLLSSASASPAPQAQSTSSHSPRRRTAEDAELDDPSTRLTSSRAKRQKRSPSATHSTPARTPTQRRTGSSSGSSRSWQARFFRENSVAGSITGFASKLVSRNPGSGNPSQTHDEPIADSNAHGLELEPHANDPMHVNDDDVVMANPPYARRHEMNIDENDDDVDIWAVEAARTPRPAPASTSIPEIPLMISDIPQHPIRRRGDSSLRTGLIGNNDDNSNVFSLLQTESDTKNASPPDSPQERPAEFNLDDFFSSPIAVPRMLPPTSEQNIKFNEKSRLETLERLLEHERERDIRAAEEEEREIQEEFERETRRIKARRARQLEKTRKRLSSENHSDASAATSTPSSNAPAPAASASTTQPPSASIATHATLLSVEGNKVENGRQSYGYTAPSETDDSSMVAPSPSTRDAQRRKVISGTMGLTTSLRPLARVVETGSPTRNQLAPRTAQGTFNETESPEDATITESAAASSQQDASSPARPEQAQDDHTSSAFDAMWQTMPEGQEQTRPGHRSEESSLSWHGQAHRVRRQSAFEALWENLLPQEQGQARPESQHVLEAESERETNREAQRRPQRRQEPEPGSGHRPWSLSELHDELEPARQPDRQPSQPPERQPVQPEAERGPQRLPGHRPEPFVRTARTVFFEDTPELRPAEEPAFTQEEASDEEESTFLTPVLKPLPDKSASPTKSCLRPATKPKTPGRVVEFTSSTMTADAEDGEVLAERAARDENALRFAEHFALDTENRVARSPLRPYNEDGDVLMTDVRDISMELASSGTGRGYVVDRELSDMMLSDTHQISNPSPFATTGPSANYGRPVLYPVQFARSNWQAPEAIRLPPPRDWTLEDWLALAKVVKEFRQQGPLNFKLQHTTPATRKAEQRGSGVLLDKVVHDKYRAMVVKDWHLDIVDAFHTRAGLIWNEHYLLRRLFSLFIAETRHGVFELAPERA